MNKMRLLNYSYIFIFLNIITVSSIKSEENNIEVLDSNSNKNKSMFVKYSKPETPEEFYDFFNIQLKNSSDLNDSTIFFPYEDKFLFLVELYFNKGNNKLRYKIHRINYNEFKYKNDILKKLDLAWDACEESIKNEIKKWEVNYLEYFIITGYYLIIEFNYNAEVPILNYKYIRLQ